MKIFREIFEKIKSPLWGYKRSTGSLQFLPKDPFRSHSGTTVNPLRSPQLTHINTWRGILQGYQRLHRGFLQFHLRDPL
jgi:hypothetical protein